LKNIAQFCPNIDTLLLWYCGRLSPETTLFYAERLIQLRSITLHGPFLVTDQVFATLLETIGKQLQRFSISHSGRLSTKTLAAIAQQCPNLKELQLSGCSAVGDMDILKLADAVVQQSITMLDLSGTVSQVSDATMIAVLRVLGPTLRKLNLTNGLMFTDKLLVEGLTPHCTNLQELVLSNCTQLTDRGMKSLFEHWIQHNVSNKKSHDDDGSGGGLKVLELAHCDQLTSTSLVMAFEYCGAKLVTLNLNSVYQIDDAVFTALSQHCSQLNCLDVSWCRTVSDAHLEELYMSCSNLLLVKIWGCNRVTEYLMPPRKDARLIGRECDTI
jgi:DNA repair protein RAD7